MSLTPVVKIAVFAILVLVVVAILADLTLRSKAVSKKENGEAKQGVSEVKKEVPEAEEKKVQPQVEVNWKKRYQRYTYDGKEKESEDKWKEEEEDKPLIPSSGD
jgi:uncharacterized membrane protein (DUF106 family)